jgi:enterobactin synthetase component D
MTFAAAFRDFRSCIFVETTFDVDLPTLRQLETLYRLPNRLHRAVLKRQVEYLAGRSCAQQAITRLTGQTKVFIPSLPDRSPGWPAGIVGSITHTEGYAAALVATSKTYQGIGIDCERLLTPEKLKLQKHICTPNELEALCAASSTWSSEELLTLVFSAKESLYKCLYPWVQKYFGFSAARVTALDIAHHTLVIQLEEDLHANLRARTQWTGHFVRQQHLLMTAILYPL